MTGALKEKFSISWNYIFLIIFILPTTASAQSSSSDEVTTIVYNLCTYLSGGIASALAVLVLIYLGFKTMRGKFDWHHLVAIAVGLGLVIGGSYYGKTVLLNGA